MRAPTLVEVLRQQSSLPDDITVLVRIAGGCEHTIQHAARLLDRPVALLVRASRFYLEQVVFYHAEDSYRVLALAPDAPQEKIREHGRWLMRWLHPDRERTDWEAVYATRIATAWDDLKTPSRRAIYDRSHAPQLEARSSRASAPVRLSLPLIVVPKPRIEKSGKLRTLWKPAMGAVVCLCISLVPATVGNAPPSPAVSDECLASSAPDVPDCELDSASDLSATSVEQVRTKQP
ncbi:J domain-containing protein [Amorphus sp. 3PC139-8]|uniref:J domain-containing protein n=1 Tax=Amorphus sp. 3PC139-8 TaxID=2735676 RepID=UPI00345CF6B0